MSDQAGTDITEALEARELTLDELEAASANLQAARDEMSRAVLGLEDLKDNVLTTIVAGGHILLVGVPGLAKTVTAESTSRVLGLDEKRIQFTQDTMPADILGTEIPNHVTDTDAELIENRLRAIGLKKQFGIAVSDEETQFLRDIAETAARSNEQDFWRFIPGPIFAQLLLADEINRGDTRVQAALLQAMAEKKVTVGENTYKLPVPFHVLATQNPIEQEGTYPLPEAQLDRFLMELELHYPSHEVELALSRGENVKPDALNRIITAEELVRIQEMTAKIPVPEDVTEAITALVRATRIHSDKGLTAENDAERAHIAQLERAFSLAEIFGAHAEGDQNILAFGAGPRAIIDMTKAVRARALLKGHFIPTIDDVMAVADPLLRHRIRVNDQHKHEGITNQRFIAALTSKLAPAV